MRATRLLKEEHAFLGVCFPAIFTSIVSIAMEFTTILIAGRIDQDHLNGVGLANSLFNIIASPMIFGYESAFDTYGPQVYASPGLQHELGTVLLKCLAQGALVYLLVLGPYLNLVYVIQILPTEKTGVEFFQLPNLTISSFDTYNLSPSHNLSTSHSLNTSQNLNTSYSLSTSSHSFNTDEEYKNIAIQYLRWTCVVGYMDYIVETLSHYFIIQSYNRLSNMLSILMMLSHLLLNYILINYTSLSGVVALSLAAIGSRAVTIVVAMATCGILKIQGRLAWAGCTMRVLQNWRQMLKLGMSGVVSDMCEIGIWEIATLLSQLHGAIVLSTVLIQMQVVMLVWSVAAGVAYAASTTIGKALSEDDNAAVKRHVKLTVLNSLAESCLFAGLIFILRNEIARWFTDETEVVDMFVSTVWMTCLHMPLDHVQTGLSRGVLIAFGDQVFVAVSMLVTCYGVGCPILLATTFLTTWHIYGLYIAFFAFSLLNLVAIGAKLCRSDLGEELEKCRERLLNETPDSESEEGMPLISRDLSRDMDHENSRDEPRKVVMVFSAAVLIFLLLLFISLREF